MRLPPRRLSKQNKCCTSPDLACLEHVFFRFFFHCVFRRMLICTISSSTGFHRQHMLCSESNMDSSRAPCVGRDCLKCVCVFLSSMSKVGGWFALLQVQLFLQIKQLLCLQDPAVPMVHNIGRLCCKTMFVFRPLSVFL